MSKTLMIGTTSTYQDYTIPGGNAGGVEADLTATVPSGSVVIGGGFSVYDATLGIEIWTVYVAASMPMSNGWRFHGLIDSSAGDTVRLTVYASYATN